MSRVRPKPPATCASLPNWATPSSATSWSSTASRSWSCSSGRVTAVESLLRWVHPDGAIRAPGEFLDVAEVVGPHPAHRTPGSARVVPDGGDLGRPARRRRTGGPRQHLGSPARRRETCIGRCSRRSPSTGLDPTRLVLELTETHMPLIAELPEARPAGAARPRGAKSRSTISGTGYSSLTRITELPVDILKIDRRFVAGMEDDPACSAVVRGVLSIGDALGLDVIAEGVEEPSQAARLHEYGCTRAQGYLYSRPLPEEALLAHLAAVEAGSVTFSCRSDVRRPRPDASEWPTRGARRSARRRAGARSPSA